MSSSQPVRDDNVLHFIRRLSEEEATGKVEIHAGSIRGALSFSNGKLVDAQLGHLTGFQAMNALVAMREPQFTFDPTVIPPTYTSITSSERVVLKQFFGIDTVNPEEWIDDDEDTIIQTRPATPDVPEVFTYVAPPAPSSFTRYALPLLAIALGAAAAVALFAWREHRGSVSAVATTTPAATTDSPAQSPASEEPVQRVEDDKPVQHATRDLTGKWNVVNTVDTTAYQSFKNMQIGFSISINQTGTSFTGTGAKVSENGRSLPNGDRTPIHVKGSINGDRVEATFFEEGSDRNTNGRFVWRVDRAGRGLTGIFATTAARSSGRSAATKNL